MSNFIFLNQAVAQVLALLLVTQPLLADDPLANATLPAANVTPSLHVRDGKPFGIVIVIPNCDPKSSDYTNWTASTREGSGLNLEKTSVNGCQILGTLTVEPTALPGTEPIFLEDGKGAIKQTVHIGIVDSVPAPIPPGIAPQVDVLWTVQDPHITEDTFGAWVRKRYYAIEVVVGNNSGFELQIASIGFDLRDFDGKIPPLADGSDLRAQQRHVPTNDYHVVRATPEKEQIAGPRAIVLNIAEAFALLGTGLTPFFKNTGHQATFSTAVTVFGNPVNKGLSLVWPDLTVPDLNRLDNLALHGNAILPNNTQTRTIVFVDRHVLAPYFARNNTDHRKFGSSQNPELPLTSPCEAAKKPQRGYTQKLTRKAVKETRALCDHDEPQDVKYWLGNLILVGDEVEYKQRIYVPSGQQQQPSTAKLSITPEAVRTVVADKGATVTLSEAGGDLTALAGQQFHSPTLDLKLGTGGQDKSTLTGTLTNVDKSKLLPLGKYAIDIQFQGVTQTVYITLKDQQIAPNPTSFSVADLTTGKNLTLTTSDGDFLNSTTFTPDQKWLTVGKPNPDPTTPLTKITLALSATKPIVGKVTLTDTYTSQTITLTVTAK